MAAAHDCCHARHCNMSTHCGLAAPRLLVAAAAATEQCTVLLQHAGLPVNGADETDQGTQPNNEFVVCGWLLSKSCSTSCSQGQQLRMWSAEDSRAAERCSFAYRHRRLGQQSGSTPCAPPIADWQRHCASAGPPCWCALPRSCGSIVALTVWMLSAAYSTLLICSMLLAGCDGMPVDVEETCCNPAEGSGRSLLRGRGGLAVSRAAVRSRDTGY